MFVVKLKWGKKESPRIKEEGVLYGDHMSSGSPVAKQGLRHFPPRHDPSPSNLPLPSLSIIYPFKGGGGGGFISCKKWSKADTDWANSNALYPNTIDTTCTYPIPFPSFFSFSFLSYNVYLFLSLLSCNLIIWYPNFWNIYMYVHLARFPFPFVKNGGRL